MSSLLLPQIDVAQDVVARPFCSFKRVERGAVFRGQVEVAAVTFKLVYFVPEEARDPTREACFAAGAGRIGAYERCSWYTVGTGTFLAGEGADPAIGSVGEEERVQEYRVEMVVPEEKLQPVLDALRDAHPYEEVAFDVIPLHVP
jgi:hypothetical protein